MCCEEQQGQGQLGKIMLPGHNRQLGTLPLALLFPCKPFWGNLANITSTTGKGFEGRANNFPELRDLFPHPVEPREPGQSRGLQETARLRLRLSQGPQTEQCL